MIIQMCSLLYLR